MLLVLRLFTLVLALVVVVAWTGADADLWGHVRFGGDSLATRSLPAADPYSFTSDRPWINHEWLAELAMYAAYMTGGSLGLVYLKTIIVCGILACITAGLRHRSFRPAVYDVLIAVALIGMFPRYHAFRPQVFSLLLFAVLLLALSAAERGRRGILLALPFLFALWANLHGGFLVGLGILAIWLSVNVGSRREGWVRALAVGSASVAATLATPYGIGLWRFLRETVGLSRPDIMDWRSPFTAGAPVLVPWLVVVVTAANALWRARRAPIPAVAIAVVMALAFGSARIGRLDAFFALSVVMLLGPAFGRERSSSTERARWQKLAAAAAVLIAAGAAVALSRRSSCIEIGTAPEPQSTAFLYGREGRVLTYFDWGQYAIWHLAPQVKVSMDGRRETVYSQAVIDSHFRLYDGEPGSTTLVRELTPDLIWLPVQSPAVPLLEQDGWRTAFRGPLSVVLAQRLHSPAQIVESLPAGPRCFPDR